MNLNNTHQILQDVWSFENRLLETLEQQTPNLEQPENSKIHSELVGQAHTKKDRIVARLTELGSLPEGYLGVHTGRLTRLILEVANSEERQEDATSHLMISYGIKQLEIRMYRELFHAAKMDGDSDSVKAARLCLEEAEAAARRLLYCIGLNSRNDKAA